MRNALLMFLSAIIIGCASSGKNNDVTPAPGKAILITPADNELCTTGKIINTSISDITFNWSAADNADSYELVIRNLINQAVVTRNTNTSTLSVSLTQNTPYSWYVVTKSSKLSETATSDIHKFYNAGEGIVSYAPYPAELLLPGNGQKVNTSIINLSWKGGSVLPGTIAGYSIYLGKTENPPLLKSNVTDSFYNTVEVTKGNKYYWRIVTIGIDGNMSQSNLYSFEVAY